MIVIQSKQIKDTLVSRFQKFLIKISFIPVQIDKENTKDIFKLSNINTFTYIIVYWGIIILPWVLNMLIFKDVSNISKKVTEKANLIDNLSMIGFASVSFIEFPSTPLILAKALSVLPSITRAQEH